MNRILTDRSFEQAASTTTNPGLYTEELVDMLYRLLPFVECIKDDPAYKAHVGANLERDLRALLVKVGA